MTTTTDNLIPTEATVSLNQAASIFGFSSAKHFLRNVAPELKLTPTKRGNRWAFSGAQITRALDALAHMTVACHKAEASFPQRPTDNVRCFRADEIAVRCGYSPSYFRRSVAPRLGLRAVRIGRFYWFVAASVEAIVAGRKAASSRLSECLEAGTVGN